jgi:hypothetical protein
MVSEDNGVLMHAIANSDELSIFKTELVKDVLDYKWNTFAGRTHIIGLMFHITYVVSLLWYINEIFL